MKMILIAIATLLLSAVSGHSEITEKLQRCHRHGLELNDCLKTSIQGALKIFADGYPEYKIPPIEPIEVEPTTVPAGTLLNFDQKYDDIKLHNYSSVEIEDVKAKITGEGLQLNITCYGKEMSVDGKYVYDNAFLDGVNLTSKGDIKYSYVGRKFYVSMEGEVVDIGADRYLQIKQSNVDILSCVSFSILFKSEDNDTAAKLTTMFNAKANELITDNRKGYEAMYANEFKRIANAVLAVIPYDKLFSLTKN